MYPVFFVHMAPSICCTLARDGPYGSVILTDTTNQAPSGSARAATVQYDTHEQPSHFPRTQTGRGGCMTDISMLHV